MKRTLMLWYCLKSITFDDPMETHVFIDKVDQFLESPVDGSM